MAKIAIIVNARGIPRPKERILIADEIKGGQKIVSMCGKSHS